MFEPPPDPPAEPEAFVLREIPRPVVLEVPRRLMLRCRQDPRWAALEIIRLGGWKGG